MKSTVLGSKAAGAVRTYLGGFRRWKRWASSNHVCLFPANPFQVAIYLQCLLQDANSPSPVLNAVYSIDWAQQMAGLSKISDHPLVALMVSASQRLLGRPKVKKDPVTPEMLKALVESKITDKSPSVSDRRSAALCLMGYEGCFRFSELSQIKACDVKFFPSYASIFLESSETDQFRDGRGSLSRGQTYRLVLSRPWKNTSQLRRSTSPMICLSSEPLLLLGRKRWSEAKGLAIRELANLLRMLLEA